MSKQTFQIKFNNQSGRILSKRYRLERILGVGAMGAVYAATDLRKRQSCAIKLLHQNLTVDEVQCRRFVHEANTIAQLFHPNIVEVREFDVDADGLPYLVMELLRGEDLYERLERVGRLCTSQALDIARQIGSALHAAHSIGIIHRDIKPENIFLCAVGGEAAHEAKLTKVVDFGISKTFNAQEPRYTAFGYIMGTPQYISPEATEGQSELLDPRTDQWALGVILYRMLSGQLPFSDRDIIRLMLKIRHETPTPLAQLAPEVPEHAVAAIMKALAKKPGDRHASVQDFVRALFGWPPLQCQDVSSSVAPVSSAVTSAAPLPRTSAAMQVEAVPTPIDADYSIRIIQPESSKPESVAPLPVAAVNVSTVSANVEVPAPLERTSRAKWSVLALTLLSTCSVGSLYFGVSQAAPEHARTSVLLPSSQLSESSLSLQNPAWRLSPPLPPIMVTPLAGAALLSPTRGVTTERPRVTHRSSTRPTRPGPAKVFQAPPPVHTPPPVFTPVSASSLPPRVEEPELRRVGLPPDDDVRPLPIARPAPPPSSGPVHGAASIGRSLTTMPIRLQFRSIDRLPGVGSELHLPDDVKLRNRGQTVNTVYTVCVHSSGSVESVRFDRSILGADEAIRRVVKTWRYPQQPAGTLTCTKEIAEFTIE